MNDLTSVSDTHLEVYKRQERSSRGYCKSCFCRKSYFNTFYRYVGNLDYNRAHMDGYSCLCVISMEHGKTKNWFKNYMWSGGLKMIA